MKNTVDLLNEISWLREENRQLQKKLNWWMDDNDRCFLIIKDAIDNIQTLKQRLNVYESYNNQLSFRYN